MIIDYLYCTVCSCCVGIISIQKKSRGYNVCSNANNKFYNGRTVYYWPGTGSLHVFIEHTGLVIVTRQPTIVTAEYNTNISNIGARNPGIPVFAQPIPFGASVSPAYVQVPAQIAPTQGIPVFAEHAPLPVVSEGLIYGSLPNRTTGTGTSPQPSVVTAIVHSGDIEYRTNDNNIPAVYARAVR